MFYRKIVMASVSAGALFAALPVQAQEGPTSGRAGPHAAEPPMGVQEVVVTALKRVESVQSAPAAVTALSGAALQERGVSDIAGLQFAVPSLQSGAALGETQIAIRGIGNAPGGPSTAVYVDGVYQPIAALADLTAVDIARVEVLRGPQGTLYGRNANGGAINFISNAPGQGLGGYVSAQYRSYGEYGLQGMLNVPLTDTIATRAVVSYSDRRDGFIRNVIPGQQDLDRGEVLSGRLRIGGALTDTLSVDLNLQGKRANGPFQYFVLRDPISADAVASNSNLAGAVVPLRPRRTSASGPSDVHDTYGLAALTLDWRSPFGDLKSVTAYQRYRTDAFTDQDGVQLDVFPNRTTQRDRTFTEELNLSRRIGPVDGILGAFYMDERGRRVADYPFPLGYPAFGLPPGSYATYEKPQQDTVSRAIYADLTLHVSNRLRLIGGLRYSRDKQTVRIRQEFGGVIGGVRTPFFPPTTTCPTPITKLGFDSTTGKLGAQYDISEGQNVYGTVATGYLAGGLNELNCPAQNIYQPEKITSYELGYKAQLLGSRLTVNVAAFYYDFTDLQIAQLQGFSRPVTNAGSSTVKGVEFEANWVPDTHWLVGVNATYLDARYEKYLGAFDVLAPELGGQDVSGNRLNSSPRLSGNVSVAYRTAVQDWGGLVFRADVAARSRVYFRPFNQPQDAQSAYGLLNLSLTWTSPNSDYLIRLFDDNVTNTDYIVTLDGVDSLGARIVTYGTPNQVGIEVRRRF